MPNSRWVVPHEYPGDIRLDALDALRDLLANPHLDLGDLIYDVREREGNGWDGPWVKQWSNAVTRAKEVLKSNMPFDQGPCPVCGASWTANETLPCPVCSGLVLHDPQLSPDDKVVLDAILKEANAQ